MNPVDDGYDVNFNPRRWMHTPMTAPGDGRGLGKPIRRDGVWSGQSRMDVAQGKVSFIRTADTRIRPKTTTASDRSAA